MTWKELPVSVDENHLKSAKPEKFKEDVTKNWTPGASLRKRKKHGQKYKYIELLINSLSPKLNNT